MGKKLLFLLYCIPFFTHAQQIEQDFYFSEVIGKNIKHYKIQSQLAYHNNDFERADFLFDSLINHVINGSLLDNFEVRKLSGRSVELNDFEKPVFLMTYASWCTPGVGEIPALNSIVEEFHKEIDFVVLFWDSKEKVKAVSKEYHTKIHVVYVDETENTHNHIVQTMKHSLGFPTSFFINEDKKIVDVRRGVLHPYNEAYSISYELNYNSFLNGITFLKSLQQEKSPIVSDTP